MEKYNFQYCQKIVVFSADNSKVLLAKRKGEKDYDGTFSFIGGKLETTDGNILEGIKREKNEEVGADFKIKLYPEFSTQTFFVKKDGNSMVLPHYYAQYVSGEVKLSDEYSEYKWVPVTEIAHFEPKIDTIPGVIEKILKIIPVIKEGDLIEI